MKLIFNKFNDLNKNNILFDYHIHTNQTDGIDTIETIINKAIVNKLSSIAITEHVRKDTEWFDRFVDMVRELGEKYANINVYVGCETKAIDKSGNLDVSDKILYRSDIVLGSVHRVPNGNGGYHEFSELTPHELAYLEFELSVGMLEKAPIDVLAHPGGMFSNRYGGYPIYYFKELMKLAKYNDKAIELNSRYINNTYDFLQICAEINPKISLGSDAHKAEDIGSCTKLINKYGLNNFQKEVHE